MSGYRVEQTIDRFEHQRHEVDVCIVGGGMAGLIAAVAAARNGATVMLVHDRPVLGGNASSEVRMWICGAHGRNLKETGILEEIQLENCFRNPQLIYPIWDTVLYEKAFFTPGLTTLLNTTCQDAEVDGDGRLLSITGWTLTTQTYHTVHAKLFIDCSGDCILAPLTGARVRAGRESASDFGEDIQPSQADAKTMGNSLLLQLRETDGPQPFAAPIWAYRFEAPEDLPHRRAGARGDNFWWLELGGLRNTIGDAEAINRELMKVGLGVWDYIKHRSPHREQMETWMLEFVGAVPGKRENRRYVGDHMLTQHDVRDGGRFEDVVAYGGWTMDDHHPAGLLYPGKPTIFHDAPSPFGIPYRTLYSADVPNLMMAGRNTSVTHAALSATRVMGTTSVMGQATGTAAALCVRHGCDPRDLYPSHIGELQRTLLDDDCFLPGLTRAPHDMTRGVVLDGGGPLDRLTDGHERDGEAEHAWSGPVGEPITLQWSETVAIEGLRLVLDSDLNKSKRMPCSYPRQGHHERVPESLLRAFRVEAQQDDGTWRTVAQVEDNHQRLVEVPAAGQTRALRFIPEATWGADTARVFSLDVLPHLRKKVTPPPAGETWRARRERVKPADLAPPESGLEDVAGRSVGA